MKPRQHFICTEATLTFMFAMKPHQHFICTEAMPIFVFAMTLHQHSICIEVAPTLAFYNEVVLAPIFKGNMVRTSQVQSDVAQTLKMLEYATKKLKLHEYALRGEMTKHQLQIHNLLSFWRKVTLSKFQRHDVKQHHSKGR